MDNKNKKVIAGLQSRIDHLETELAYINELMTKCGFPEGIKTLKMSAEELVEEIAFSAGE